MILNLGRVLISKSVWDHIDLKIFHSSEKKREQQETTSIKTIK